jgi:predicted RNase H-like HicB family nuclease
MNKKSESSSRKWRLAKSLAVEIAREEDGRWIAEIPVLPGVLAYGATRKAALAKAETLALRVLAERLENGEPVPELGALFAAA